MGDFGIKISQANYNALTAADYQLIFNSGWPSLAIAYETTVTLTVDGLGNATSSPLPHGLKFPPLTMAWRIEDGISTGRYFPNLDRTNVYIADSGQSIGVSITYHVKCYNLDLSVERDYAFTKANAISYPYDPDYGIKLVKEGEDIESTDLRNFILHSRAQAPLVLAVKTTLDENGDISYTNPAGYTPWAFGYAIIGGVYVWADLYAQATPRLFLDNNSTFRVDTGSTEGGSLVMLRDPLFASNDISVSY